MNKIILGRTGIISSGHAFGALPIQRVSPEYAGMLLRKAYHAGITFFDTARGYSDSEYKIGLALSDVRENIHIATKSMAQTGEQLLLDLDASLAALKTDYIDIYQLHNPAFCPAPGDASGLYDALLEAKSAGKIRFIGITNHRLNVAEQAVLSGLYDTLQFPLCYLASEKDLALVRLCREKNVGFIAMKALSGGLIKNSRAAAAWMAQIPNALPIWGVQREHELDEFISYMQSPPEMTSELNVEIERDRLELAGNFCRACGYCMPCPAGIEIPTCARMSQLIRRAVSANWLDEKGRDMMFNIENCIECGQCKAKCPYELDTPVLLRHNLADYRDILSGKAQI